MTSHVPLNYTMYSFKKQIYLPKVEKIPYLDVLFNLLCLQVGKFVKISEIIVKL